MSKVTQVVGGDIVLKKITVREELELVLGC